MGEIPRNCGIAHIHLCSLVLDYVYSNTPFEEMVRARVCLRLVLALRIQRILWHAYAKHIYTPCSGYMYMYVSEKCHSSTPYCSNTLYQRKQLKNIKMVTPLCPFRSSSGNNNPGHSSLVPRPYFNNGSGGWGGRVPYGLKVAIGNVLERMGGMAWRKAINKKLGKLQ